MSSGFQQYITGYTVANLWRYPIRRRVAFASAFEYAVYDVSFALSNDVNVSFEDVLNHVTKYFLTCFTLNRNRHLIACVSSQCQNCECT